MVCMCWEGCGWVVVYMYLVYVPHGGGGQGQPRVVRHRLLQVPTAIPQHIRLTKPHTP